MTICVYNLPLGMCMKEPFIFLPLIIPGPKSLGRDLDVFLRPLMDELKELWFFGVDTWDSNNKENFKLRVALMWTISDFPAYGMLSGWSTHGRLSCPHCMEKTGAFWLQNGRKHCWFDCTRPFLPYGHEYKKQRRTFKKDQQYPPEQRQERRTGEEMFHEVSKLIPNVFGSSKEEEKGSDGYGDYHNWTKKSIFWELPYWHVLKIRHNIDLMHTEKNNGENLCLN